MKTKTFDCVKMKEECQRACEKAYGGLPLEERRKKMRADILADPVLEKIFRQTVRQDRLDASTKPQVAEMGVQYRPKEQP